MVTNAILLAPRLSSLSSLPPDAAGAALAVGQAGAAEFGPGLLFDYVTDHPLVATVPLMLCALLLVGYLRFQYQPLAPADSRRRRLQRRAFRSIDAAATRAGVGYADRQLGEEEFVGTLDMVAREAESELWVAGFKRTPFTAYAELDDGREEISSWIYRRTLLSRRQVRVRLFESENGTDVYAAETYSLTNPFVAHKHLAGRDYDPEGGAHQLLRLLPEDAWVEQPDPDRNLHVAQFGD